MKKFLLLIVSYDTFGGGTGMTGAAGVAGVTATTVTIAMMRPTRGRNSSGYHLNSNNTNGTISRSNNKTNKNKYNSIIIANNNNNNGVDNSTGDGIDLETGSVGYHFDGDQLPLNQRQQPTHNDHPYSYHRQQQKRRHNNNNNNSHQHPHVYDGLFDDMDNISDIGDNNNNNSNTNNARNQTTSTRNFKHWITDIRIPFYIIIFILAVVGNSLVILTLVQNKRMRTVTNVFLLNLSISDLLLAVFCMPFTLIPTIMQDFIFGKTVCVMIRYLQAVSVAVSCFTLVAISLERYFAICRPLQSRSWQTVTHAYISIVICWALSAMITIPIATYNKLVPYISFSKCEEKWPAKIGEQIYTSLLDLVLLLVPIFIMSMAYGMICFTLWKGIRLERLAEKVNQKRQGNSDEIETMMCSGRAVGETPIRTQKRSKHFYDYSGGIRQSNSEKSQAAKLRVIRMLFVIVLEFFVCWCPLYFIQTWLSFDSKGANENISPTLLGCCRWLRSQVFSNSEGKEHWSLIDITIATRLLASVFCCCKSIIAEAR
ncbi:cholecystokinin receptor type A-like [Octopus vulgaris]|uniref:Gastrin/cholecystokinin type B receptor n=1 Tax=Octopus vulgaris TaxID=6645 RepID=A0AA36B837_OCTVU|nr:cholecystokinin receptor type A-like [Octopus vulgaris]